MLTLSILVFFFTLFNLSSAMDKQEAIALCMQQYSIGEDVLKNFMLKGEVPDENNRNQKCIIHCILNKLRMVDDNGNMDMSKIKEMLIRKYDKMSPENVLSLVDKCPVQSGTDACEKLYQFYKCHMQLYLKSTNS